MLSLQTAVEPWEGHLHVQVSYNYHTIAFILTFENHIEFDYNFQFSRANPIPCLLIIAEVTKHSAAWNAVTNRF